MSQSLAGVGLTQQRVAEVRNWVYGILLPKIMKPDSPLRNVYVDAERSIHWIRALTHETADRSPDNTLNYEREEFVGDAIITTLARQFFVDKYPKMRINYVDNLVKRYTSGDEQSKLLKKLEKEAVIPFDTIEGIGFGEYNLRADVFEALFGALYIVAESYTPSNTAASGMGKGSGAGNAACSNLFNYFYGDLVVDLKYIHGDPSTQVAQILSRFPEVKQAQKEGAKYISQFVPEPPNEKKTPTRYTIRLLPQHIEIFKKHGLDVRELTPNMIIGMGAAKDIDLAKASASAKAFDFLTGIGATWEWADAAKKLDDINRMKRDLEPGVYDQARRKFISQGYTTTEGGTNENFEILKSDKMSGKIQKIYILYGLRPNGTRTRLHIVKGSLHTPTARIALINMYARGEKDELKDIQMTERK